MSNILYIILYLQILIQIYHVYYCRLNINPQIPTTITFKQCTILKVCRSRGGIILPRGNEVPNATETCLITSPNFPAHRAPRADPQLPRIARSIVHTLLPRNYAMYGASCTHSCLATPWLLGASCTQTCLATPPNCPEHQANGVAERTHSRENITYI